MLESNIEFPDGQLNEINAQLQEWLVSGQIIVDQSRGIEVINNDNTLLVKTGSFSQMEEHGVDDNGVIGACRIITPSIAGELLRMGLVSNIEYYLFGEIWHPAIVATIKSANANHRVFIDVGMRKPIPIAIPITGEEYSTDFYQKYGNGIMTYTCSEDAEGLHLRVNSNGKEKGEIIFRKMNQKDELPIFTKGFQLALESSLTRTTFENGTLRIEEVGEIFSEVREAFRNKVPEIYLEYGGDNMGVING